MAILGIFFGHWYLSLFSQTFFLHRYSAHKMFTMNKFWEKFFYLFTYITQGSSFLSPKAYAILHRMHHAYSDTEKDPHSPHFAKNIFDMMWKTKQIYYAFLFDKRAVAPQFDRNYPFWATIEKIGGSWISRVAWGSFYVILYIVLYKIYGFHWMFFLLLPIHFLMGPIHGAIVNWSGHKYGYQNFDNQDKSRNSLVLDVLMMGELFQNNHHKLPNRVNFATKWFELDPTYPVIKLLSLTRIIQLKTNAE